MNRDEKNKLRDRLDQLHALIGTVFKLWSNQQPWEPMPNQFFCKWKLLSKTKFGGFYVVQVVTNLHKFAASRIGDKRPPSVQDMLSMKWGIGAHNENLSNRSKMDYKNFFIRNLIKLRKTTEEAIEVVNNAQPFVFIFGFDFKGKAKIVRWLKLYEKKWSGRATK